MLEIFPREALCHNLRVKCCVVNEDFNLCMLSFVRRSQDVFQRKAPWLYQWKAVAIEASEIQINGRDAIVDSDLWPRSRHVRIERFGRLLKCILEL